MLNPVPTLNVPITGSPPQAEVQLNTSIDPLRLTIPDTAELPPEGDVYAIIGDPEDPELEGEHSPAGEWVSPPPPAEPDEGSYQQAKNLTVEVSLEELREFAGQTVQLRYQGVGESGLTYDSDPISLKIN
ncbi:hypothetical protein [Pseudomonas fluorescens]|uniref:hypothetical protein n=1 Tax=Pseudomonas fluorescens TaxID=294 RepID=UPI0012426740|nr:hypothetical protein [Pseudomonas fluorescens]VVM77885.1 hypothetical protein PS639_02118 [Pseudomonas fluorescens]